MPGAIMSFGRGFPECSSSLLMDAILGFIADKGNSRTDFLANYLYVLFSLISAKSGRILNDDLAPISKQNGWVVR
jgi:hypothetical protein